MRDSEQLGLEPLHSRRSPPPSSPSSPRSSRSCCSAWEQPALAALAADLEAEGGEGSGLSPPFLSGRGGRCLLFLNDAMF